MKKFKNHIILLLLIIFLSPVALAGCTLFGGGENQLPKLK